MGGTLTFFLSEMSSKKKERGIARKNISQQCSSEEVRAGSKMKRNPAKNQTSTAEVSSKGFKRSSKKNATSVEPKSKAGIARVDKKKKLLNLFPEWIKTREVEGKNRSGLVLQGKIKTCQVHLWGWKRKQNLKRELKILIPHQKFKLQRKKSLGLTQILQARRQHPILAEKKMQVVKVLLHNLLLQQKRLLVE